MMLTQRKRTSPLVLVKSTQDLFALVAGLIGLCMSVEAGRMWDQECHESCLTFQAFPEGHTRCNIREKSLEYQWMQSFTGCVRPCNPI